MLYTALVTMHTVEIVHRYQSHAIIRYLTACEIIIVLQEFVEFTMNNGRSVQTET